MSKGKGTRMTEKDIAARDLYNAFPEPGKVLNFNLVDPTANLSDYITGCLKLAVHLEVASVKDIKKFKYVFERGGMIQKARKHYGHAFVGPDGKHVVIEGHVMSGDQTPDPSPYSGFRALVHCPGYGEWVRSTLGEGALPDEDEALNPDSSSQHQSAPIVAAPLGKVVAAPPGKVTAPLQVNQTFRNSFQSQLMEDNRILKGRVAQLESETDTQKSSVQIAFNNMESAEEGRALMFEKVTDALSSSMRQITTQAIEIMKVAGDNEVSYAMWERFTQAVLESQERLQLAGERYAALRSQPRSQPPLSKTRRAWEFAKSLFVRKRVTPGQQYLKQRRALSNDRRTRLKRGKSERSVQPDEGLDNNYDDEVMESSDEQDATPQIVAEQDDTPQIIAEQDDTPHIVAKQDDTPHIVAKQDDTPHIVAKQDDTPHIVAKQDDTPQITAENEVVTSKRRERQRFTGDLAYELITKGTADVRRRILDDDNESQG